MILMVAHGGNPAYVFADDPPEECEDYTITACLYPIACEDLAGGDCGGPAGAQCEDLGTVACVDLSAQQCEKGAAMICEFGEGGGGGEN